MFGATSGVYFPLFLLWLWCELLQQLQNSSHSTRNRGKEANCIDQLTECFHIPVEDRFAIMVKHSCWMLNSALPLFISAHLCFKHRNVFILVEKKEFSRKHFSCVFKKTFNFVRFNTSNTKKTNCHVFRGDSISMGEFNFQIKKHLSTHARNSLSLTTFSVSNVKELSHSVQTAYFLHAPLYDEFFLVHSVTADS